MIKRPGFTAVAVLTLALGIGANSAIFSVLNAVFEALRLTALGVGLGLAGAFAATRVLRSLLFEVQPTDPATQVDPLVALRYE